MGFMLAGVSPDIERSVLGVAGHELRPAAAALGRLRHVRGDLRAGLPERPRPDADPRDDRRCCGTAARAPATSSTSSTIRCPGTPAKTVLLHVAFGDWQVSELVAMHRGPHDGHPDPPSGHRRRPQPRGRARAGASSRSTYPSDGSGSSSGTRARDPIPIAERAAERRAATRTRTRGPIPTCSARRRRSCSTTSSSTCAPPPPAPPTRRLTARRKVPGARADCWVCGRLDAVQLRLRAPEVRGCGRRRRGTGTAAG